MEGNCPACGARVTEGDAVCRACFAELAAPIAANRIGATDASTDVHLSPDGGIQAYPEPYPRPQSAESKLRLFVPGREILHVTATRGEWVQVSVNGEVVGWVQGRRLLPPVSTTIAPQVPNALRAAPGYSPVIAPQYVVVAPQQIGNGFAIAALTLGIIGAVLALSSPFGSFLGGVCGLLGLIFGLLGLRNVSQRGASLAGLAISGVVLGSIAVAASIYTGVNFYRLTNAIHHAFTSPTTGVVAAADPALDRVHVTSCHRDEGAGSWVASGTLTNTSGDTRAFTVAIAFRIAAGTSVVTTTTDPLAPDQTGSWYIRGPSASVPSTSCTAVTPPPTTS